MTEQERLDNYKWDTSKYVIVNFRKKRSRKVMRNNVKRMIEDLLETYEDDPVIDILSSRARTLQKTTNWSDDEIAEFLVDLYNDIA